MEKKGNSYFIQLGEAYKANKRQEGNADVIDRAKDSNDYPIALFEQLVITDMPEWKPVLSNKEVLDTTFDTLKNDLSKRFRALTRDDREILKKIRERGSRVPNFKLSFPSNKDGSPPKGLFDNEIVALQQFGESASNFISFTNGEKERNFVKKHFPEPETEDYYRLESFQYYFAFAFSVDGVNLSTFFKEPCKPQKNAVDPNIAKYIKLGMRLSRFQLANFYRQHLDEPEFDYLLLDDDVKNEQMGKVFESLGKIMPDDPYDIVKADFKNDYVGTISYITSDILNTLSFFDPSVSSKSIQKIRGAFTYRPKEPKMFEQFLSQIQRMQDTIAAFRKQTQTAILHPELDNAKDVRAIIKENLHHTNPRFLFNLIADNLEIKQFYREVAKQIASDDEPEFMRKLLDELKRQVEERKLNIPTSEDLDIIISSDKKSDRDISPKELKSSIDKLSSIPRLKETLLKKDDVPWQSFGIMPPSNLQISFGNSPYELGITLQYQTQTGEDFAIRLDVNARKDEFDWSVLEDATTLPTTKQLFMQLAEFILTRTKEIASANRRITVPEISTTNSPPKKKTDVYIRQPRESERRTSTLDLGEIRVPVEQLIAQAENEKKDKIIIPSNDEYQALFREACITDERIKRYMRTRTIRYNQNPHERLKPITRDDDGKHIATLRAGSYRFVLKEVEATKGERLFAFDAIKDRKIAYDEINNS